MRSRIEIGEVINEISLKKRDSHLLHDSYMYGELLGKEKALNMLITIDVDEEDLINLEERLRDIIWFNRYNVRNRDENGEIIDPNHPGEPNAQRIENEIPEEELYYDDLGWGILSGKYLTVRWALGDDWDTLYK